MSIYKLAGVPGEIHTSVLPSGDVTVRGYGDNAAMGLAATVAARHYGTWIVEHQNWIVRRRNAFGLMNELAALQDRRLAR